jgi:hypothetical protein
VVRLQHVMTSAVALKATGRWLLSLQHVVTSAVALEGTGIGCFLWMCQMKGVPEVSNSFQGGLPLVSEYEGGATNMYNRRCCVTLCGVKSA